MNFSQIKLKDKVKPITTKSRFKKILGKPSLHIIAEIKRASPSKGDLRSDLDIVEIAKIYEREGVELVSVLSEEKFFKGSLDDLLKVRQNTNLSILCKDFIIDEYQIYEAKLYGAEAILLIARILTKDKLKELVDITKKINMDAVVEVHDQNDLKKVLKIKKDIGIIGINHRNLEDFSIDLETSTKLLPKIPKDKIVIAESGIESASQIKHFKEMGVNGILIGESLMMAKDIRRKISNFMRAISEGNT